MYGKYTLNPVGKTEFHWDLKARDAQTMLSSQVHSAKSGAESSIQECRVNCVDDARYERRAAADSKSYFILTTVNGEVIGTSQMYSSDALRDKAIASCKESGPVATMNYGAIR